MKKKDVFQYFQTKYMNGAYSHLSGAMATEAATGISHQAIYQWGDVLPMRSQILIELVTKGKLKREQS